LKRPAFGVLSEFLRKWWHTRFHPVILRFPPTLITKSPNALLPSQWEPHR
jgi:hypothetical protein